MPVEPLLTSPSSETVEKLTVVPLADFGLFDPEKLPDCGYDLGFGLTVEDFSKHISELDLGVWERAFSEDQMAEIKNWTTCLVHKYRAVPTIGDAENSSSNFLGYVIAHLRLIRPNRTTRADQLHLRIAASGKLDAFSCSKSPFWPQVQLTDCEKAILGISMEHLGKLKSWMPWIADFHKNWRDHYPLWISLFFLEKFYTELDSFRTRHLLRVMALEALLCSDSEKDFGRQALKSKVPKMLGWHNDLYAQYENKLILFKPEKLLLTDQLIDDMYTLRNKVAHGGEIPGDWMRRDFLRGWDQSLCYADVLCETAGSILRQIWLKIISDDLQTIFAHKKSMQKFFRE